MIVPVPRPTTPAALAWAAAALAGRRRVRDDRGEGVISVAIAVLIMALLGALMWVGFQSMMKDTQSRTDTQVSQIGKG